MRGPCSLCLTKHDKKVVQIVLMIELEPGGVSSKCKKPVESALETKMVVRFSEVKRSDSMAKTSSSLSATPFAGSDAARKWLSQNVVSST